MAEINTAPPTCPACGSENVRFFLLTLTIDCLDCNAGGCDVHRKRTSECCPSGRRPSR